MIGRKRGAGFVRSFRSHGSQAATGTPYPGACRVLFPARSWRGDPHHKDGSRCSLMALIRAFHAKQGRPQGVHQFRMEGYVGRTFCPCWKDGVGIRRPPFMGGRRVLLFFSGANPLRRGLHRPIFPPGDGTP